MTKLDNIMNEDYENKNWFSENYFWIGTIVTALICILLYAFGGSNWNPISYDYYAHGWTDGLYFKPLFYGFLNSFGHANWQHAILNMLCFFVVGLYLERKTGTIKLVLLVIAFAFLSTGITAANSQGVGSIGFSGVNFALYFYVIVDFIFLLFQKDKRTKSVIVPGAVIIALIYLAMCFNGGTTGFGFEWYPYDLIHNQGHTGGAFAGIVVGLIINLAPFGKKKVMAKG